jgi:Calcineurin-like phosphoesterase
MSLMRRQFLIFGGMAVGASLTTLSQKVFWADKTSDPSATTASNLIIPQSKGQAKNKVSTLGREIAPKGLFAPSRGDVRIVVISDLNSQYGSTSYEAEVVKAIALTPAWQPDLVLCSGDMVAGQSPSLSQSQIKAMWAAFDKTIGAPLRKAKLPYGFTVGNHDASSAVGTNKRYLFAQERVLATAHWQSPQHNPGLNFIDRKDFPFNYTFEQNNIFYLVWDASSAQITSKQLAWVVMSLASPTAQAAKMRIVIGHLPLYAVAVGRDELGEFLFNAEKLRSILEHHRVHTYISGHHHAYFPAHRGKLQLLHTGALGAGARPLLNSNLAPQKTLTVIDINLSSATTVYTTYNMTTLNLVNQLALPRIIVGPNGSVLRRDVEWKDLTPAERSLTYVPSS